MLRVVDRVRLMAIPTWVGELPETIQNQATQTMVAHCLGGVFTVYGVGTNTDPEGLTDDAEVRVLGGTDDPQSGNPHPQTIWVEPDDLEIVEHAG